MQCNFCTTVCVVTAAGVLLAVPVACCVEVALTFSRSVVATYFTMVTFASLSVVARVAAAAAAASVMGSVTATLLPAMVTAAALWEPMLRLHSSNGCFGMCAAVSFVVPFEEVTNCSLCYGFCKSTVLWLLLLKCAIPLLLLLHYCIMATFAAF